MDYLGADDAISLRRHEVLRGPISKLYRAAKKQRSRYETEQQYEFVEWATDRGLHFWCTPNELIRKKNRRQTDHFFRMGLRPGVADIIISDPVPGRPEIRGIAIEFKSRTGRVSKEQRIWAAKVKFHGWLYVVARSADQAKRFIEKLGL